MVCPCPTSKLVLLLLLRWVRSCLVVGLVPHLPCLSVLPAPYFRLALPALFSPLQCSKLQELGLVPHLLQGSMIDSLLEFALEVSGCKCPAGVVQLPSCCFFQFY